MAYAAPQTLISAPPDEPILYGRPFLEGAELQQISQRSDLRGAMQLGAHIACIATTTLLVWLALPFWYLLVPAMAVHGVTIVTLFAPMHECVHRTGHCLAHRKRDRRLDRRCTELPSPLPAICSTRTMPVTV